MKSDTSSNPDISHHIVDNRSLKLHLSSDLPISLKYIRDLSTRVADRYPLVPKYKVILIVKSFFETLRYLLASGNSITLRSLFTGLKIITYTRVKNNKYERISQPKLTTSKELK